MAKNNKRLPSAPQVPDPDLAVGRGSGEPAPVRAERQAPHLAVAMAFEGANDLTGNRIQDLHPAAAAASRQMGPIWAERDTGNPELLERDGEQIALAEALEVVPFPAAALLGAVLQQRPHLRQVV